jgi:glycosyltransferase involved in cell wall biosynthesis
MKIALFTHSFFPRSIGGRERYVNDLAKFLSKKNKVEIFTCSDSLFTYKLIKKRNLKIHYFPTIKVPLPSAYYRIPLFLLSKLLFENFDIYHAHDIHHFTTLISTLICRIRKKPLIITEHGYFPQKGFTSLASKIYEILFLGFITKTAKKVLIASNFMKNEVIERYKIEKEKVLVVPNFIDLENYKEKKSFFRKGFGLENKKLILCIGRIAEEKGFQYAIKALPLILKKIEKCILVIIGARKNYLNNLRKLVKKLNLEKDVVFVANASDKLLKSALYSCDVVIIPSLYEPFGLVALEAMAYGKPIIASNVGGLKDFLKNEKNALVVPPKNFKKIAESVIRILRDKKLRTKLSKNSKNEVKKFDWKKNIIKIEEIYEKIF